MTGWWSWIRLCLKISSSRAVFALIGNTRNGNPTVTPEVIQHVCLLANMMAASMYYSQIEDLMFELSMWRCTDDLFNPANELFGSSKRDSRHYIEFWKPIPPNK